MEHRNDTVKNVRQALIAHYLENGSPITLDSLAERAGYSAATVKKMLATGVLPTFADCFKIGVMIGGRPRKRMAAEPSKGALATELKRRILS